MPLAGDLLRRDGEEAVRLIVKELVSQAREAAPRCVDPEDAEGLHDFRVSIRRLRSSLSAWKELLRGVATKRDRRTLAGFQKRTGSSRDAEVALVWLESQRSELCPEHLPSLEWLVGCLGNPAGAIRASREPLRAPVTGRTDGTRASRPHPGSVQGPRASRPHPGGSAAPTGTHLEFESQFAEWADGFESRMAHRVPSRGAGPPYAEALAERVDRIAHRLDARVGGLGGDRERGPHRVRIACKRLRYLVEPVGAESEVAVSLVDRCKRLQDVLGTLNDANILDDLLRVYLDGESSAKESGVLALCRLNAARADASYQLFRLDWVEHGGLRTLLDEAAALARQLRAAS